MRIRLFMALSTLLVTFGAVAPVSAFFDFKPSRLDAVAARHGLRDMVCIAMADGQLSAWERAEILADAHSILYPQEYVAFKRALDRISPPRPKKTASKNRIRTARRPAPPKPRVKSAPREGSPLHLPPEPPVQASEEPMRGPVIPAGAILPDRMASTASLL